MDYGGGDH